MTITDADLDDLTFTDDAGLHIMCCRDKAQWDVNRVAPVRFLCGVEFHPEMVGELTAGPGDDGIDPDCMALLVAAQCPPLRPTHMHCPFTGKRC